MRLHLLQFIHGGIFFKFALDLHGLYNGDEYAMKVASMSPTDAYLSARQLESNLVHLI